MSILSSEFAKLASGLRKAFKWLDSSKAETALKEAAGIALQAAPIVADIAALVPGGTFAQIAAAYSKYGVPFMQQATADPTQLNNYLLNLATSLVQKNLPPGQAGMAVNLIQTGVQLALTTLKGGSPTGAIQSATPVQA